MKYRTDYLHRWLGQKDSNLRMTGSKPVALPLGYTPITDFLLAGGYDQIRTSDPIIMSDVL